MNPTSSRALVLAAFAGAACLLAAAACGVGPGEAVNAPPPPSAAPQPSSVATSTAAPGPSDSAVASAAETSQPAPPQPPPEPPCGGPVPGMACIPAGNFLRGSVSGEANEQPQATIYLDAYFMDVTEVTNEAHDACVKAKKCKPVHTVYPDFDRPKQPKAGARWYDAVDFCKAAGKHLPTEAEWEKAARGTDGRRYPWGDETATCERAVIMDKRGRSCGVPQKSSAPDRGRTFEVATLPPNQYGLYDMSGNAWEWVNDYYSESYAACGDACLGKNPKGPCGGVAPCDKHEARVVRGGSWFWTAPLATTTYRRHHKPSNNPYHHYGFRCAASLEEAAALRAGTGAGPSPGAKTAPAPTAPDSSQAGPPPPAGSSAAPVAPPPKPTSSTTLSSSPAPGPTATNQ